MEKNNSANRTGKNVYVNIHILQTYVANNPDPDEADTLKVSEYGGVSRILHSAESIEKSMCDWLKKDFDIDVLKALFDKKMLEDSGTFNNAATILPSLSTHRACSEFEEYVHTDLLTGEQSNESRDISSTTMYRCSTLAAHTLFKHLSLNKVLTAEVVQKYTEAFFHSAPNMSRTNGAAFALPCALLITVRNDRPICFPDAFEKPVSAERVCFPDDFETPVSAERVCFPDDFETPVSAGKDGFANNSMKAFESFVNDSYSSTCEPPIRSYVMAVGDNFKLLGTKESFQQILSRIGQEVVSYLVE